MPKSGEPDGKPRKARRKPDGSFSKERKQQIMAMVSQFKQREVGKHRVSRPRRAFVGAVMLPVSFDKSLPYIERAIALREGSAQNWRKKARMLREHLKQANQARFVLAHANIAQEEAEARAWSEVEAAEEAAKGWKFVATTAQGENRRLLGVLERKCGLTPPETERWAAAVQDLSKTFAEHSSVVSEELAEIQARWQRCEDQRFAAVEQVEALEKHTCDLENRIANISMLTEIARSAFECGGDTIEKKLEIFAEKATFLRDWGRAVHERNELITRCFRRGMRIMVKRIEKLEGDLTMAETEAETWENAYVNEKMDRALAPTVPPVALDPAENVEVYDADPCAMCEDGECEEPEKTQPLMGIQLSPIAFAEQSCDDCGRQADPREGFIGENDGSKVCFGCHQVRMGQPEKTMVDNVPPVQLKGPEALWVEIEEDEFGDENYRVHFARVGYGIDLATGATSEIMRYVRAPECWPAVTIEKCENMTNVERDDLRVWLHRQCCEQVERLDELEAELGNLELERDQLHHELAEQRTARATAELEAQEARATVAQLEDSARTRWELVQSLRQDLEAKDAQVTHLQARVDELAELVVKSKLDRATDSLAGLKSRTAYGREGALISETLTRARQKRERSINHASKALLGVGVPKDWLPDANGKSSIPEAVTRDALEDACQNSAIRLASQAPGRLTSGWVDRTLDKVSRVLGLDRTQSLALRVLVKRPAGRGDR